VVELLAFFRKRGLGVYYEPARHWLPQRRFSDTREAAAITAAQVWCRAPHLPSAPAQFQAH
jgi:hypothetical protein